MELEKHITDEELFQRIKKNDARALKILFERYFSALCFFSWQIVKNKEIAEESVSDVFLNIWIKRNQIELKTFLKPYLYTAVRNKSLRYIEQNKNLNDDLNVVDKEEKISLYNADSSILYEQLSDEIELLLNQLPEKRQIIFRLNRINGLSYKEISEVLSISISTVQNQMLKAIKFIAEHYPHFKEF